MIRTGKDLKGCPSPVQGWIFSTGSPVTEAQPSHRWVIEVIAKRKRKIRAPNSGVIFISQHMGWETGHLIWLHTDFSPANNKWPDPQILLLMWLHRSHSSQVKETMLFVLPTGKERVSQFSPGTTVLPLPSHLPPHLLTKPAASFIHSCHAGTTLYETQGSGTWNSKRLHLPKTASPCLSH